MIPLVFSPPSVTVPVLPERTVMALATVRPAVVLKRMLALFAPAVSPRFAAAVPSGPLVIAPTDEASSSTVPLFTFVPPL